MNQGFELSVKNMHVCKYLKQMHIEHSTIVQTKIPNQWLWDLTYIAKLREPLYYIHNWKDGFYWSLSTTLAQRPPLTQLSAEFLSRTSGSIVFVPGVKEYFLQTEITATLASKSANLCPKHALGPWPNPWYACLRM